MAVRKGQHDVAPGALTGAELLLLLMMMTQTGTQIPQKLDRKLPEATENGTNPWQTF